MTHALVNVAVGVARRTWIVGALCVVVCAVFAARTAEHLIEARTLDEGTVAPLPAAPRAPSPPVVAAQHGGSGDQLVDRNMFCSTCTPRTGPDAPPATDGIPATQLPLILVATSLGSQSIATIRDTSSGAQGAYGVGDRLPGAGVIEKVGGRSVQFRNDALGRSERVDLLVVAVADRPSSDTAAVSSPPPARDQAWVDRVRAVDDHTFEVDRTLIRELVAGGGTGGQVKGVRIMPMMKDGKLAGVRVLQARPDSLAAAVGLRTGDVLEAVDGTPMTSPDQLLDIMARIDKVSSVVVQGRRAGKPLDLTYRLR